MTTYSIATGKSRTETSWKNRQISWKDLCTHLEKVKRTHESVGEYRRLSKPEKGRIKDIGGFVGGVIEGGHRKSASIRSRSLVTLDIDYGQPDTIGVIEDFLYGTAWCLYSTHSHTKDTPRYRLIIPLSRDVTPDEYIPIARKIADTVGIDVFDDSTFEPARLMYWPSCPRDGEYVFRKGEGAPADADAYLAQYKDWRDVSEWPLSKSAQRLTTGHGSKQEDPTSKPGIIGAFCRTYSISDAIAEFLPEVYTQTDRPDRYTYALGSTAAGVVVYDDKWIYSHHGTDPCCEKLCNAFDMVRLHLFGNDDLEADPDTPVNRLPSFRRMEEKAQADKKVSGLISKERYQELTSTWADAPDMSPADTEWAEGLQHDRRGKYLPTPYNFGLILNNDPGLKDAMCRDAFRGRDVLLRDLPWRKIGTEPNWTNSDDAGLIDYISRWYEMTGKQAILDALDLVLSQHQTHPVREYLEKLTWDGTERLDTLLTDYLGAEDSPLVRAMTRKHFTAAVARVMQPGCKYDYILTLIGPEGLGKSSFVSTMAKGWFSDSLMTIEGKEAMEQVRGQWLIEIGELTNYKKSTNEAYKAFISKREDTFRPAYARKVEIYPRQCVFFATTNEASFLKGDTGNRRFWVVECTDRAVKSVWEDLPSEVDQIWAEALTRYREHEPLYLSAEMEKAAREKQADHNEVEADERRGLIEAYLRKPIAANWETLTRQQRIDYYRNEVTPSEEMSMRREKVSTVEILVECFGEKPDDRMRYKAKEINQILKRISWVKPMNATYNDPIYGKQRGWIIEDETDGN